MTKDTESFVSFLNARRPEDEKITQPSCFGLPALGWSPCGDRAPLARGGTGSLRLTKHNRQPKAHPSSACGSTRRQVGAASA